MKQLKNKIVLITGVSGQDGSTLADKYLARGWKVIGITRWAATGRYDNISEILNHPNFVLELGDVCEGEFVYRIMKKHEPCIVYNMAGISLVPESFKIPKRVFEVNTLGVLNFLETIRNFFPDTRLYQASSSEQIGEAKDNPQDTNSHMIPASPYAVTKLAAYHLVRIYRKAYGLFTTNGLLWNHEGPRRGETFVSRKITIAIANIKAGNQEFITLGNIESIRDWGLTSDYCDAMILMMESDEPDDYAVNSGEAHSIREFVVEAFKYIGLDIVWYGSGIEEVGKDQYGNIRVRISAEFFRPVDCVFLRGNHDKITYKLGWKPKTVFKELVHLMMKNDCDRVK
jgi:GDPmannose 4,6-dehydratase